MLGCKSSLRLKTIASAVGLLQKSVTHTQGQMEMQLAEVRIVSVSGIKAQFRVPPEDVIMADSMPFCKLKTNSYSLINLIFENNADAPAHDSGITLTCCNGLSNMVQLRNDAQAQQLASAIQAVTCNSHSTNACGSVSMSMPRRGQRPGPSSGRHPAV